MPNWRLLVTGVLAVILAVVGIDWAFAFSRLDDVLIESHLDPGRVVADGQSSTTITLRITENGQPRAGDLVQLWIDSGSGLVTPNWVITDDEGRAQTTYTPNKATIYDPHDEARIFVMDINIGYVVEVGKRQLVVVPLVVPKD